MCIRECKNIWKLNDVYVTFSTKKVLQHQLTPTVHIADFSGILTITACSKILMQLLRVGRSNNFKKKVTILIFSYTVLSYTLSMVITFYLPQITHALSISRTTFIDKRLKTKFWKILCLHGSKIGRMWIIGTPLFELVKIFEVISKTLCNVSKSIQTDISVM